MKYIYEKLFFFLKQNLKVFQLTKTNLSLLKKKALINFYEKIYSLLKLL